MRLVTEWVAWIIQPGKGMSKQPVASVRPGISPLPYPEIIIRWLRRRRRHCGRGRKTQRTSASSRSRLLLQQLPRPTMGRARSAAPSQRLRRPSGNRTPQRSRPGTSCCLADPECPSSGTDFRKYGPLQRQREPSGSMLPQPGQMRLALIFPSGGVPR